MFYAKVYNVKGEFMIAVCDKDLLGKTLSENELNLFVSEDFYKGDEISPAELRDLLKKATIANLVGIRCVHIAEEMGLVQKKISIQGIPHVQIFDVKQ